MLWDLNFITVQTGYHLHHPRRFPVDVCRPDGCLSAEQIVRHAGSRLGGAKVILEVHGHPHLDYPVPLWTGYFYSFLRGIRRHEVM